MQGYFIDGLDYSVMLIYCPSYHHSMDQSQHTPPHQNIHLPTILFPPINTQPPQFNIQNGIQFDQTRFFQKFKNPHYKKFSAFRVFHQKEAKKKKEEVLRKHRGNYRKYTVAEKQQAVKQLIEGVQAKEISKKYGIPRRNLLRWKKNGCQRREGGGRPNNMQIQLTLYNEIDNKTLKTEKEIRSQAKRLSKMPDFQASKGWYYKFSKRYNQWKRQQQAQKRTEGKQLEENDVFLLPTVSVSEDEDEDEIDDDSEVTDKNQ